MLTTVRKLDIIFSVFYMLTHTAGIARPDPWDDACTDNSLSCKWPRKGVIARGIRVMVCLIQCFNNAPPSKN